MKLFELFDHSLFADTLYEGPKKADASMVDEIKYGTWTIKALKQPEKASGLFAATAFHDRNPQIPRVTGHTQAEAIAAVKQEIDRHVANDKFAISVSRVTIDFNAEFTKGVLQELGGPTGVHFERVGSEAVLVVASVEYMDLGDDAFGTGDHQFQRLHKRLPDGNEQSKASAVYCCSMSGKMANSLGLQGSGRYVLEYLGSDDYKNQRFKLVFDSIVSSKEDKRRIAAPALTVAVS